jgi:hypothetical protein
MMDNTKGCLTTEHSGKQEERKTKPKLEKIGYQRSREKSECTKVSGS